MRLKNKKTGEIIELAPLRGIELWGADFPEAYDVGSYDSLAELNEEWEDVPEEPKEYWIIDTILHEIRSLPYKNNEEDKRYEQWLEELGLKFESKEEAKKAVEKLKAWKRLKDKGFRFDPVDRYEALCGNGFNIPITATMPPEAYTDTEVSKDLDICFGGEE